MNAQKYAAEFIGTFWLTFAGCGSAVIAAGVSAGRYRAGGSVARIRVERRDDGLCDRPYLRLPSQSRGHGRVWRRVAVFRSRKSRLTSSRRCSAPVAASALLYMIASGAAGFDVAKGFASNGYGEHSPGHYSFGACFITEVVMSMMFLFVIMGSTHGKAPAGFAPLAIGLALVMIHLVSIPITNTSVNPARSTGPALFVGGWALAQLWMFWLAPLIGGVLGGVVYRWLSEEPTGVVEGRA